MVSMNDAALLEARALGISDEEVIKATQRPWAQILKWDLVGSALASPSSSRVLRGRRILHDLLVDGIQEPRRLELHGDPGQRLERVVLGAEIVASSWSASSRTS